MTLINCPECSHQVSSDALVCPECGFPVRDHLADEAENGREETRKSKGSPSDEETYSDRPFSFRCGRAFTLIRTGKWHEALVLLEVKAWLGRYVGFVLGLTGAVVAVPAVIGVSLPLPTVWKVFLFVSVAAIVLMPLSIAFAHWMLKRVGFALRPRHFATGLGEGIVLAVVFAAMYAVSQYAQGVGKPDPILSPPNSATNEPSASPGSGTQAELIKPIGEILAERDKDGLTNESRPRDLPPPSVKLTVAPVLDGTHNSQQEGDSDSGNPVSTDERVRVLLRLLGEWEMTLKNDAQRTKIGMASVVQVPSEPWVLWRISGNDGSLRAIELAGFDHASDRYIRWLTTGGNRSGRMVGKWNQVTNTMTWELGDTKDGQSLVEVVSDDVIMTKMTLWNSGVATRRQGYELRRIPWKPTGPEYRPTATNTPLLNRYVGNWVWTSTYRQSGMEPIKRRGRCVSVRLDGEPAVLERRFYDGRGLADIRLLSVLDNGKGLRCCSFDNAGAFYDLRGTPDFADSTMTWSARFATGESLSRTDSFARPNEYTSTLKFMDQDRRQVASETVQYCRN